jgi:hypothetical protein
VITRKLFVIFSITAVIATLLLARHWPNTYGFFLIILPLVALGIYDMRQRNHTILRLYPVIGHLRFLFESIRPEIQQFIWDVVTRLGILMRPSSRNMPARRW